MKTSSGKALLLSPHCDDIALSCAGILLKRKIAAPLKMVTIFSHSNFAPRLPQILDEKAITRIRNIEDRKFCERIAAEYRAIGLPEPPLRGYPNFSSIFDEGLEPSQEPVYPVLIEKLRESIGTENSVCLLLAPLGLGYHVDHLLLYQASLELASERSLPLVLYEDLPYSSELSSEELDAQVKKINSRLKPRLYPIDDVIQGKIECIKIYVSQPVSHYVRCVLSHAQRLGAKWQGYAERFWSSDSSYFSLIQDEQEDSQ